MNAPMTPINAVTPPIIIAKSANPFKTVEALGTCISAFPPAFSEPSKVLDTSGRLNIFLIDAVSVLTTLELNILIIVPLIRVPTPSNAATVVDLNSFPNNTPAMVCPSPARADFKVSPISLNIVFQSIPTIALCIFILSSLKSIDCTIFFIDLMNPSNICSKDLLSVFVSIFDSVS